MKKQRLLSLLLGRRVLGVLDLSRFGKKSPKCPTQEAEAIYTTDSGKISDSFQFVPGVEIQTEIPATLLAAAALRLCHLQRYCRLTIMTTR